VHNSKKCFKCGIVKPLTEFYKQKGMADGHVNKCKECNKKDVRDNYSKNKDYYAEYNRSRDQLPNRVELKKKYIQTDKGKENARKAKEKWANENIVKKSASIIVGNAVKDGKLIKPDNCQECGEKHDRIHGHHNDYNYPMVVSWLCPKCHTEWHKKNGSGING
jgi:hypothetical protein